MSDGPIISLPDESRRSYTTQHSHLAAPLPDVSFYYGRDYKRCRIHMYGREVYLDKKEAEILLYMFVHRGQCVSMDELVEFCYQDPDFEPDGAKKSMYISIGKIRKKLGKWFFITRWSVGIILPLPVEQDRAEEIKEQIDSGAECYKCGRYTQFNTPPGKRSLCDCCKGDSNADS